MFGSLGFPEILMILVLALLIFGPKRLPEVGRTIGKGLAEFRRASSDLKRTVNAELALDEDEHTRSPRRPEVARGAGADEPRRLPRAAAGGLEPPENTTPRGAEAEAPAAVPDSPPTEVPAAREESGRDETEDEPATTTH